MPNLLKSSLEDLRDALLALKPTGSEGFEGLLATVLGKITGHVFRLASSGSQYGKDGEAVSSTSHISFEGKLYTTDLSKKEVLGKATEIIGSAQTPEVWILGATVGVKTQIFEPLQSAFEKNAISLLVLDWPDSATIPPLACACALAGEETAKFLFQYLQDPYIARCAEDALKIIGSHKNFYDTAAKIQRTLQEPTLGNSIALAKNHLWLREAFSERKRAREVFGQLLAPLASMKMPVLDRSQLEEDLNKFVFCRPHSRIVALIGGEGCGKSWIFAQSWAHWVEQPLCIVIPASDLRGVHATGQIEPYFIDRLIEQTGDSVTDFKKKRWQRHFDRWKTENEGTSPRLVVFVDGLNQNHEFEWGRWLDGASAILAKLGGVLVISVRQSYFRDRIQGGVLSNIEAISIPEWTLDELRQLLSDRGIKHANVSPVVTKTLRNPRLLSIAFELLDNTQIENFSELSVERLLFEQIRMSAKDNSNVEHPDQFIKRLSLHAKEILNRVKEQKHEDRLVFECGTSLNPNTYNLSDDLLAVIEGRFFHPLPEDPTLYSLTDDGLAVALGISIVKSLQQAERNRRELSETLEELLEPIAALDNTSQAVFSALLLASVDERCTTKIQQALIEIFLRLQNINAGYYPAFSSVTRTATDAAMQALFSLSIINSHTANKDWLVSALRNQRKYPQCWSHISQQVDQWLRIYSLAPELSVLSSGNGEDQAKVKEKTEEKRQHIEERLESMTPAENAYLNEKMHRDDKVDPSVISSEAFMLLAGMPLSEFSEALVAWSFSQSLNSSHRVPYEDFQFLVRLNKKDWSKTRESLMKDSVVFQEKNASRTAKWTFLNILRATSTLEDAALETVLYEELTASWEKFPPWRLVEKYCPNDPCDPKSSKPEEIEKTAERYLAVDVSESFTSRMMVEQDHFIEDALPGIARFAGEVATMVHRALASNIAGRDGEALRLGLFYFEPNTALLVPETVKMFLLKAEAFSMPYDHASFESLNYWVTSQYCLLIAFPHLSGCDQIETLMSLPSHGQPISQLTKVLKPVDPEVLDRIFDYALQSCDEGKQSDVLMFASYSGTTILPQGKEVILKLCTSTSSMVRALAFNVISYLKESSLLKRIANSTWRADALDPTQQFFEVWYGSKALIAAGAEGIITPEKVIERISPKLFGIAAAQLGKPVHGIIAERIISSIGRVLAIELEQLPPLVEQNTNDTRLEEPPRLSLTDLDETLQLEEFFKRYSETPEQFDARQKRGWEAFEKFEQSLTREKARLVIEDVGIESIEAMLASKPEQVEKWAKEFLELPDHKLMYVQNIALMFARVLSCDDPALSRTLFERLAGRRAFVTLHNGLGKVPLDNLSIWKSADNLEMDALRTLRLDRAATDHEIAVEILMALISGKAVFIDQYAKRLLQRVEPSATARALMVYGFGETSSEGGEILDQYSNAKGVIGTAAKAARFAYDRNQWARHWFAKMCQTESPDDFWRYSVLFLKIIDARFELWGSDFSRKGVPVNNFEPSFESKLKDRIKSWAEKRDKTLFGTKAPSKVFVLHD